MNAKIKEWLQGNYSIIIGICIAIIFLMWGISRITTDNGASVVNTTGISNTQSELNTIRQQQSTAIEQNTTARESIRSSITLNERASKAIGVSEEYNNRTKQAITDSQSELARTKDIIGSNTRIIGESRRILESAKERNRTSK